jgi:hypothetical protein
MSLSEDQKSEIWRALWTVSPHPQSSPTATSHVVQVGQDLIEKLDWPAPNIAELVTMLAKIIGTGCAVEVNGIKVRVENPNEVKS